MDMTNAVSDLLANRTKSVYGNTLSEQTNKSDAQGAFDGIFNAAVNMIKGTNDYLHQAQEAEVAYATGKLKSTHELAVIEQKASLSLQYTVAIKNALLSAYKEIMTIQV